MKNQPIRPESIKVFDVIRAPLVTEKSTVATENNQYSFKVAKEANKQDIKVAIEKLYKVKVESVNTINVKGKTKRFRGRIGKRNDIKKAIVRLSKGQTIDMSAGL